MKELLLSSGKVVKYLTQSASIVQMWKWSRKLPTIYLCPATLNNGGKNTSVPRLPQEIKEIRHVANNFDQLLKITEQRILSGCIVLGTVLPMNVRNCRVVHVVQSIKQTRRPPLTPSALHTALGRQPT